VEKKNKTLEFLHKHWGGAGQGTKKKEKKTKKKKILCAERIGHRAAKKTLSPTNTSVTVVGGGQQKKLRVVTEKKHTRGGKQSTQKLSKREGSPPVKNFAIKVGVGEGVSQQEGWKQNGV